MILRHEIMEKSESWGVSPDIVDKDYVLGHFLAGFSEFFGDMLIFKGGTCLRKCWFPDYRFSEDLDFSSAQPHFVFTDNDLQSVLQKVSGHSGILFDAEEIIPLISNDVPKGLRVNIRYWGANHSKVEQPPAVSRWLTRFKLEISTDELIVTKPLLKPLFHTYSDLLIAENPGVYCYGPDEIIAEKLRALRQRSYTAPRDFYDLYYLTRGFSSADWQSVKPVFLQKMAHKNLPYSGPEDLTGSVDLQNMLRHWGSSLGHQLTGKQTTGAERIIGEVIKKIKENL